MKIHEMEVMVRVAEAGSMTVAARQLHLTPAAVSAMVGRVEDSLGLRLFERTTRAIHPTDEGLVVLEGCQEIVAQWERTLERVRGQPELEGAVHLSAPADTTYQVLAPVACEISEAHPNLQLVLHTSDAVHHLHRDAIDMAIRYGELQDSGLMARKLADSPSILVAAPDYLERRGAPRVPQELCAHRVVTLQLSGTVVTSWRLESYGGSETVSLGSPLCGDGHFSRQCALAGKAIARKVLFDVIDDLEEGRLVRVLPSHTSGVTGIHAVFPSRRFMPARVRAVDSAVSEAFAHRVRRCNDWLEHETTPHAFRR